MFQSDLFPAGEQMPAVPLAHAIGARIAALLASGRHLTRTDISSLFAEETGAQDWGSTMPMPMPGRSFTATSKPRSKQPEWSTRTAAIGGEQRLELTGFSPDRLDWYKNKGCFTEIIRYRTRLFVPVSRAGQILPGIAIGH
ncbi:hypothetical protein GCM10022600_01470 [Qipengyuania pelagi]|uniref:Uncharacterized protein n=1 Tax=Qipengyuania pelagi TaxID=994320 RepID=A0A844YBC5_9SPHN|nr:hypothetical protein [Qipengyuania pelagi]MXO54533.1 hypothetical protein [Qipengyuania pelagi]